jgi:hypothetical protein
MEKGWKDCSYLCNLFRGCRAYFLAASLNRQNMRIIVLGCLSTIFCLWQKINRKLLTRGYLLYDIFLFYAQFP